MSLPTSPSRKAPKLPTSLYQSHPDLAKQHLLVPPNPVLSLEPPPDHLINDMTKPLRSPSPAMPHREVELMHNLMRSPLPSPVDKPPSSPLHPPKVIALPYYDNDSMPLKLENKSEGLNQEKIMNGENHEDERNKDNQSKEPNEDINRNNIPSPKMNSPKRVTISNEEKAIVLKDRTFISDNKHYPTVPKDGNIQDKSKMYDSFILKDSGSEGVLSDTNLRRSASSSSGSESLPNDPAWESSGLFQKQLIDDMNNKVRLLCYLLSLISKLSLTYFLGYNEKNTNVIFWNKYNLLIYLI